MESLETISEEDKMNFILLLHLLRGENHFSKHLEKYVHSYTKYIEALISEGYVEIIKKYSTKSHKTTEYKVTTVDGFYDLRYENSFERMILERIAKVRYNATGRAKKNVSYSDVMFDPMIDIEALIVSNEDDLEVKSNYMNMCA